MHTLCINASFGKKRRRNKEREEKGLKTRPTPVLSLSSLQGPEQLGDYNHVGNAAGQADKRRLRATKRMVGAARLSVYLALCQNNAGETKGPGALSSQAS